MEKSIDKWSLIYTLIVFGSLGLLIGAIVGYIYTPSLIKYERDECFTILNSCNDYYNDLQYQCKGEFNYLINKNLSLNMSEYKMIYK